MGLNHHSEALTARDRSRTPQDRTVALFRDGSELFLDRAPFERRA